MTATPSPLDRRNADVQRVAAEIRVHLVAIAQLFVPGTKLAIIARPPMSPNGERDMVLTDDKLEDVIRALALTIRREAEPSR